MSRLSRCRGANAPAAARAAQAGHRHRSDESTYYYLQSLRLSSNACSTPSRETENGTVRKARVTLSPDRTANAISLAPRFAGAESLDKRSAVEHPFRPELLFQR